MCVRERLHLRVLWARVGALAGASTCARARVEVRVCLCVRDRVHVRAHACAYTSALV